MVKVADLWRFEKRHNPDAAATYGFLNLSERCAAQVPAEIGGKSYNGIVDAHPYALADAKGGGWYVADAGANAILHVSPRGSIKVVAVLPRQKTRVTAEAASALDLPGRRTRVSALVARSTRSGCPAEAPTTAVPRR